MPLFLFIYFFIFYNIHTFIQSYNTFIRRHLPRPLSISSSLVSSVGKTPLRCRAENRTRACLQQADALPTEPRPTIKPRRTITPRRTMSHAAPWATPHHNTTPHHEPHRTIFDLQVSKQTKFLKEFSPGQDLLAASGQQSWKCGECRATFLSVPELAHHLESLRLAEVKCAPCHLVFQHHSQLAAHKQIAHQVPYILSRVPY